MLELKEELRQAEHELERLKREWAKDEAARKRQDVRRVHKLQPLVTTPMPLDVHDDDSDGSSEWLQREMERRKVIMGGIKSSNRKVFSGSKHTRTLSLLSPERGHFPQSFPQPADAARRSLDATSYQAHGRSNTIANAGASVAESAEEQDYEGMSEPKDVLFKTGKQMMADMKDGFLTFFDDIRQATVGEEGINATQTRTTETASKRSNIVRANSTRTPSRRPGSKSGPGSGKPKPQQADSKDAGVAFWSEHGFEDPKGKMTPKVARLKLNPNGAQSTPRPPKDLDDAWDMWETPKSAKHAQSDSSGSSKSSHSRTSNALSTPSRTVGLQSSPSSASSASSADKTLTPRSSMDMAAGNDKRDAIPWPALNKLTPTNLRRTASHLMNEWEKSLTPPTGDDSDAMSNASSSLAYPAPNSGIKQKKGD